MKVGGRCFLKTAALAFALLMALTTAHLFFTGTGAAGELEVKPELTAAWLLNEQVKGGTVSPWGLIALAGVGRAEGVRGAEEVCRRQYDKYLSSGELNDLSLTVLTLLAAGEDPYNWSGCDLVSVLRYSQLPDGKFPDLAGGGGLGESGEQVLTNAHIWAVIALYSAGSAPVDPGAAVRWLVERQLEGGGFNWNAAEKRPDVDSTAMALLALAALGEGKESLTVKKALSYLKGVQLDDGGFSSWGAPNAESCGTVISALVSLGMDPRGEFWSRPGGHNPLSALLSYQLADGSYEHVKGGGPNSMATEQALLALGSAINGKTVFERLREEILERQVARDRAPGRTVKFWVGVQRCVIEEGGSKQEIYLPDAAPFVERGRTFMPVRYFAYALGVGPDRVIWKEAENKVELSLGNITVALMVGSKEITVNASQVVLMDVAPLLLPPGRVYLPARYVAESLGYKVDWLEDERAVLITNMRR